MTIPAQIAAIKERHEDYWHSDEALAEAIAAWGVTDGVNEHGVFTAGDEQIVAPQATVRLRQVREGVWVHGVSFRYSQGGMSYQPSVWRSEPYPSRDEALQAGVAAILDNIDRLGPVSGAVVRTEMQKIRKQLRGQAEQPTLF